MSDAQSKKEPRRVSSWPGHLQTSLAVAHEAAPAGNPTEDVLDDPARRHQQARIVQYIGSHLLDFPSSESLPEQEHRHRDMELSNSLFRTPGHRGFDLEQPL